MKKLFFTLSLILAMFALSAQQFQVLDANGNVVENNSSFFVYGDGIEELELNLAFTVKNISNAVIGLIAEKETIQDVEGTSNSFCLEFCYSNTTTVSPQVDVEAGDEKEWSFHYTPFPYDTVTMMYNYDEPIFGTQIMKYSLYTISNPEDKLIVEVSFMYSPDGVEVITNVEEFSNAYPMPANSVVNFDYSFNASVNAEIVIYNMMGQKVMARDINGMQGKASINVSDLTDGVYFYSLVVNGKTEKSSKLVVRH